MKYLFFFLLLSTSLLFAQNSQLELVDEVFFEGVYHSSGDTTGTSDCWGWISPDGEEYVFAGVKDGVAIIKADEMEHILTIPGPTLNDYYYHRDIKTYRNFAYISTEMRGQNEGIQVVDLSGLPDEAILVNILIDQTITSHNLSIDTASQRAYVTGSTFEGVYVYDLFRPSDPLAIYYLPETNVHDVFARNDTLWVANSHDYSIWDMSIPSNPMIISRIEDASFGYCHNIWPLKDGRFFVTTEETAGKTVKIWELDASGNAGIVSEFLAPNNLVHNAHVEGDSLYLAHYSSGVFVVNIADPYNPFAVASYDTYPLNDTADFYGCWGVYPHSPSGFIYASNFEGKVQKFAFEGTTGLDGMKTSLPVLLFPNPGSEPSLGFTLDKSGSVSLEWMNAEGRRMEVKTEQLPAGSHRLGAEAGGWPAGAYFYMLKTDEGTASGSWVKE